MKWKVKEKIEISEGATRIRKRFLLFPRNINGYWYWLESKWCTEQYTYFFNSEGFSHEAWKVIEWIDE